MTRFTKNIQDKHINDKLKTMWRINNLLADGISITKEEEKFYNSNIELIRDYYFAASQYWMSLPVKVKNESFKIF